MLLTSYYVAISNRPTNIIVECTKSGTSSALKTIYANFILDSKCYPVWNCRHNL